MAWRLFIVDPVGDNLWEIDPDGADTEGTELRDLPSTLNTSHSMTVLNGRLLIVDDSGDELWEIDPDGADTEGTKLRDLPSTLTAPYSMTVLNGRLFIADNSGDELWEIDPDGADTEGTELRDLPPGINTPYGMTVLNGRLLIADNSGDELWEIDPDGADTEGTELRDLPSTLNTPQSMTVLNGRLLIADDSGDELWEIDPDGADTEGTELRDLPSALTAPYGMTALLTLPNASAPNVTINAIPTGDEGTTVQLSAGLSGGLYDSGTYSWSVTGGTLNSTSLLSPTLTRPSVTGTTSFTASVTVNVTGSGTTAKSGTSAASSDSESFTVNNVVQVTTDIDNIDILSIDIPETPTGGTNTEEHAPTGWSRTALKATATQSVYRSQRTRTFSEGTFTSATIWGTPEEHIPTLLSLSDWTTPTGIEMRMLALYETGTVSGNEVVDTADSRGSVLSGDNIIEYDDNTTSIIGRFQATTFGSITLNNRGGTGVFSEHFSGSNDYNAAIIYLQIGSTVVTMGPHLRTSAGGGFVTYSVPTDNRDLVQTLRISGVRFILGVGIQEPIIILDLGNKSLGNLSSSFTVNAQDAIALELDLGNKSLGNLQSSLTVNAQGATSLELDLGNKSLGELQSSLTVNAQGITSLELDLGNKSLGGLTSSLTVTKQDATALELDLGNKSLGGLTSSLTITAANIPLELSHLPVPVGREFYISMLVSAGGSELYNLGSSIGSLLGGDSTLQINQDITRIRYTNGALIINDNPSGTNLSDFFNSNFASNSQIHIKTNTSEVVVNISDLTTSYGGNFATFSATTAITNILTSIVENQRFILAFSKPTTATSLELDLGNKSLGELQSSLTVNAQGITSLELDLGNKSLGGLTSSLTVTKQDATALELDLGNKSFGNPGSGLNVTVITATSIELDLGNKSLGGLTSSLTVNAQAATSRELDLGNKSLGNLSSSFTVTAQDATALELDLGNKSLGNLNSSLTITSNSANLTLNSLIIPSTEEAYIKMLVRSGDAELYNLASNIGSLLEGDNTLLPTQNITRIRNVPSDVTGLVINDNPSDILLSTFFTSDAAINTKIYLKTETAEVSVDLINDNISTTYGGNFARFYDLTSDFLTVFNSISDDDDFILAFSKRLYTEVDLGNKSLGNLTSSLTVNAQDQVAQLLDLGNKSLGNLQSSLTVSKQTATSRELDLGNKSLGNLQSSLTVSKQTATSLELDLGNKSFGNLSSHLILSIIDDTNYFTVDLGNKSLGGLQGSLTTLPVLNKPEIPNITIGYKSLRVDWNTEGDSYELRYKKTSSTNWISHSTIYIMYVILETLDNEIEYEIQLMRIRGTESSLWSDSATGTPDALEYPISQIPNLIRTVTDANSIRVRVIKKLTIIINEVL